MTHDYKRHGTTTLFAALNVVDGTIIARNMRRHHHQELAFGANWVRLPVTMGGASCQGLRIQVNAAGVRDFREVGRSLPAHFPLSLMLRLSLAVQARLTVEQREDATFPEDAKWSDSWRRLRIKGHTQTSCKLESAVNPNSEPWCLALKTCYPVHSLIE